MEERSANHIQIGKVEYPLVRCKLRIWLALEETFGDIKEAADSGNRERFASSLYSYVSAAFSIPVEQLQECPWWEITRAFGEAYSINRPSIEFPMLKPILEKKQETTKIGWDYSGRLWFTWLHLLAGKYGWDVEYIENLDLDVSIALIEEILVDDQLDREFLWSLSQNSFEYNEVTKKSKFVPLNRPEWMKSISKPVQKVKIKASELPVGVVLKWDTDTNEYTKSQ